MNDLTTLNIIFLVLSLLISGYFAGLVGMPLGPIRIFFMLFFGVNALIVFGTNLAISLVMMIPTVWNNLKHKRIDFRTGILFIILKLDQAKVPITTINMTPTNAAMGICSM